MRSKFVREEIENEVERRLAIGMIVNTQVLREMRNMYNPEYIEIPFVKTLAKWCLNYFDKYNRPPRKHILHIYKSHVRKGLREEEAELIGTFLSDISTEYERAKKFNAEYLLDEIEEHFRLKSLEHLSEDIQAEISNGHVLQAEGLLNTYKRAGRQKTAGVNPFTNAEAIESAFNQSAQPLFKFPGDFGKMVNDQLVRGGLLGMMGRAKIGKSWQLMEWAIRAARSRCNVAVIEVGDQTQEEMITRMHVRLANRSNQEKYCHKMLVPVLDCLKNQEDRCKSQHRTSACGLLGCQSFEEAPGEYLPCSYCSKFRPHQFIGATWYVEQKAVTPLEWREGYKLGRRFMKSLGGRDFKLITLPNSSYNVSMLRSQLDSWEHFEGFVPDVVVIDYADILMPEPGMEKKEERDQQNATWKALRRLAQERHFLIITATQADAGSYDTDRLKLKNFSTDRRKYDHVTGMLGLNQTREEKDQGIMRIGWMLLRQGEYDEKKMAVVLQCLQKGQPHIASYFLQLQSMKGRKIKDVET